MALRLLLGQASLMCADTQGRAKWAWLEDRRESSQLCAGHAMVRVAHAVMRVRRPSKADLLVSRFDSRLSSVKCGEERKGRWQFC